MHAGGIMKKREIVQQTFNATFVGKVLRKKSDLRKKNHIDFVQQCNKLG